MIDLARKRRMFTKMACDQAHDIRKLGNDVMHEGHEPSDVETWHALKKIRSILEELCT